MTIFEELRQPEVQMLRERYHELTSRWPGYHWEEFSSVEEFKLHLREKIAKIEKELGEEGAEKG